MYIIYIDYIYICAYTYITYKYDIIYGKKSFDIVRRPTSLLLAPRRLVPLGPYLILLVGDAVVSAVTGAFGESLSWRLTVIHN